MTSHASLTGSDLHEPKGVSGASADTVYVANGGGSGTWQKITKDSINASSVKDINKVYLTATLADVSTASATYIPLPFACTLNSVTSVISGAITVANSIITVTKVGGFSAGTMTITAAGSAEGDIDSLVPVSNNTFSANDWLKISTDGGSTTTQSITFLLEFTLT